MASIFDIPPPPVFTRDGRDGFPPEQDFEGIMAEYIEGLNPRKREKALMTQAMYDTILVILTNPNESRSTSAQFRFWTKKMFRLVTTAHAQIVTHENRPVAVKEQIYDVLVQCHSQCSHGGRDKTSNQVRRYYSWIPKELIARFVKACPLCNARRSTKSGGAGAGLAALTALGADISMLHANRQQAGDGSSPLSESTTSTDSNVTTPSKQMRSVLGQSAPFTPGSYLASAMSQLPNSASSTNAHFPTMPSPSHDPRDWTHWVNTTPQRNALAQSANQVTDANSIPSVTVADVGQHGSQSQISDQQQPSLCNDMTQSMQSNVAGSHMLAFTPHTNGTQAQQMPSNAFSSDPSAFYSHFTQQTASNYLQAPGMTHQWSSDSLTSNSSNSSSSAGSSSEYDDYDDINSSAPSPLPPLPGYMSKDNDISASFQSQLDSLSASMGVNIGQPSEEDEEEKSFQSFMSSFKPNSIESDQIDPLLRAMNLEPLIGLPTLGETGSSFISTSEGVHLVSETTEVGMKKNAPAGTPLGGTTFKFPAADASAGAVKGPTKAKKNTRASTRAANSSGKARESQNKEPVKQCNTPETASEAVQQPTEVIGDLSPYFQLQSALSQWQQNLVRGPAETRKPTDSQSDTSKSGGNAQCDGTDSEEQEPLSENMPPPTQYTEFSFSVSDMSGDTSTSSEVTGSTSKDRKQGGGQDTKRRTRPPHLDLSSCGFNVSTSLGNSQSATLAEAPSQSQAFDSSALYLSGGYNFDTNDFASHPMSGSVSAPAHITHFTQPEAPIVTPDFTMPLFNYENMDINFNLMGGNSFIDYNAFNSQIPQSAASTDLTYGYSLGSSAYQTTADLRPATAGGYLEPSSYMSTSQNNAFAQQQQHMNLAPAIHSAPYFHIPMSAQQQQAQSRELSEQIQAILDSAMPNPEALTEQSMFSAMTQSIGYRKR